METPAARTNASGIVPVPLGEVLRIAGEYERAGRIEDAQRLLDHILAAAPNQGDALHLAGIVAFRRGEADRALALMEGALRHGIDTPLYLRNICELYRVLGRLDEALAAAQRATALAPADPLCLHNQAIIHYHRLELDAALDCGTRALRIDPSLPGAHFVRAEALLLRGDWAEGWEEYEWRFRIGGAAPLMPPTDKPQWDGAPLPGVYFAAGRRPGFRRRDPVQPLYRLGAGALPRHRDRLQRRDDSLAAPDRARRQGVRALAGMP